MQLSIYTLFQDVWYISTWRLYSSFTKRQHFLDGLFPPHQVISDVGHVVSLIHEWVDVVFSRVDQVVDVTGRSPRGYHETFDFAFVRPPSDPEVASFSPRRTPRVRNDLKVRKMKLVIDKHDLHRGEIWLNWSQRMQFTIYCHCLTWRYQPENGEKTKNSF